MRSLPACTWLLGALIPLSAAQADGVGACCLGEGQCTEVPAYVCANLGGNFQGEGTTCAEACAPTECGWLVQAPAIWVVNTCRENDDCDESYEGPDARFVVDIPRDGDWFISTCGSRLDDTEMLIGTQGCCSDDIMDFADPAQDACDLDAGIKLTLSQGDRLYVTVEHFDGACGQVRLEVTTDCNDNDVPDSCEGNCDCDISGCETGADCNGNGVPDACDLDPSDPDGDGHVSLDCDADGVPNECETDCNANGVPDDCDVDPEDPDGNGHVSNDCDANGVPDECDPDCNANGVPDQCDIDPEDPDGDGEISRDCNRNAVPDACDIDPTDPDGNGEVSTDVDGNGRPDECEDCNRNGLPDQIDIDLGFSPDCNLNCIPDECDAPCGADVVFLVDTSYSMNEELSAVCDDLIAQVLSGLEDIVPGAIRSMTYAIVRVDSCARELIVDVFGPEIPGDPGACEFIGDESWGPATAILADRFPWSDAAAIRAIVPVSDAGPCRGDRCEHSDRDAIDNAIDVSLGADVTVFAVTGIGSTSCVRQTAEHLALGTGGAFYHTDGPWPPTSYAEIGAMLLAELTGRLPAECVAPEDCACPWDLDGDGDVGLDDILRVLDGWGPCPEELEACPADLDCSGAIDFADLLIVLDRWGPCP